MARTVLLLTLLLFAAWLLLPQQAPPDALPTFRAESTLALVPFNAIRGEYFALDLKAQDIQLFEDGKPREFTIFEGPGTGRRPPLELVLLFDTTTFPPPESKIKVENTYWDRATTYAFTKDWSDKESRAVLEKNGADVRVAVYRYDRRQLQRLCASTKDAATFTAAIRRLPEPMPPGGTIGLNLPAGRISFREKMTFTPEQYKRELWPLSWTLEAAIDAMKDVSAVQTNAMRVLVVFSESVGPTSTQPEDAASVANALGIRIYPVVLHFEQYLKHPFMHVAAGGGAMPKEAIPESDPFGGRSIGRGDNGAVTLPEPPKQWANGSTMPMLRFGNLGFLTGGGSLFPPKLDAESIDQALEIIRNEGLSQYVVGFAPPQSGQQKEHKLEVRLKDKNSAKLRGGQRTVSY